MNIDQKTRLKQVQRENWTKVNDAAGRDIVLEGIFPWNCLELVHCSSFVFSIFELEFYFANFLTERKCQDNVAFTLPSIVPGRTTIG